SGSGSGSGSTSGGLTTQEEQIAVMAADGSTNRDIARELTLSAKTVEHHLTSCYRKLGIRGRTELSGALQRR
ncbi:response regulator transcription factor, partial [Corynebacterium glyciniphilum]